MERGFERSAARSAVERLREEGWIEDLAAARSLVRMRGGRYGRARIERELRARGFPAEAAAAAIASELSEGEETTLSRAFERLWNAHRGLSLGARRRKVRDALARRGFAGADISAMIKGADEID